MSGRSITEQYADDVLDAIWERLGNDDPAYQAANRFGAEIEHLESNRDHWKVRAERAEAELAKLRPAALAVDAMYGWHWDRVDGALVVMPDRVDEFDARFNALGEALGTRVPLLLDKDAALSTDKPSLAGGE